MMKGDTEITAEKVQENLKTKGITVDLIEAQLISEFIKMIADIAVNQYLRGQK